MSTIGWTQHDWNAFDELLIKAADLQLGPARSRVNNELQRRLRRNRDGKKY